MKDVNGFVTARGQKLINGEGREILLRGVGLGGWLLPEGYMWRLPHQGDRPRRIEGMIEDLLGEEKSKRFWEIYFERYISEDDIRQIANEGFNSIRVPINARHIIKEGCPIDYSESHLRLIDNVISWCRRYGLYVILDLHAAPGGQTGANIDDSENDSPDLFTKGINKSLTIDLWRTLAQRYKNEWIVAGYDLLNEPLPEWFSVYNNEVMPLYEEIVRAIREVDSRHMIILEGVHWATNWSIFNKKIDDNLMLQFHKYWNNPDAESIQAYLDKRQELNVPIFMGEGGENNKDWYTGAFRLFEDHNISWNFWTWKKMHTDNSPCSVNMPDGWQQLIDYLERGCKPDVKAAERILWEYLDNISFKRCAYHPEVVRSLFRRAPVRIPAVFYGFRGEGESFEITNRTDGEIGFRRHDGVDIRFVEGLRAKPNFKHMQGELWQPDERMFIYLYPGDWVAYEFEAGNFAEELSPHFRIEEPSPCPCLFFTLDLHICAKDNRGKISVLVDGESAGFIETKAGFWEIVSLKEKIQLYHGVHKIILKAEENAVCLEWLEIK